MNRLIEDLLAGKKINTTKTYLVAVNLALVVFAIVFSNAGMLPFKSAGDFAFFAVLALMLALYRPGWAFLFFIGSLALETIKLAPANLGLAIRPYQFLALITVLSLSVGFGTKRLKFDLPKWQWYDTLPIVFALGGFLSVFGALHKGASLKQAVIATTFVVIYFLVRVYVQNVGDLKRIGPFFLSTGVLVALYGIWQNLRFARGLNSFEVMPGRPNGTFTEADWLGIYLVFLLAALFSVIYSTNKKTRISNLLTYSFLLLIYIALILTVSRSAWLGAAVITLGFFKAGLLGKSQPENQTGFWHKISHAYENPDWKAFLGSIAGVGGALIISWGIVSVFHLTTFQIGSRAVSTGGLQKITIACLPTDSCGQQTDCIGGIGLGQNSVIQNIEELSKYGCRHINLEDITKEKEAGNIIEQVYRPDPNVGIRARIYKTAWGQIKSHPVLGIGWGSIGQILGTDERGASLNASNIFLETWLGAGLLGIISLVVLLGYIFAAGVKQWLDNKDKTVSTFILLALFAILIPNLFNSGIFLAFVWAYLGMAVSLLQDKKTQP